MTAFARHLAMGGLSPKDAHAVERFKARRTSDTPLTPPIVAATDTGAEIKIYDAIGYDWWTDSGVTHADFVSELEALGEVDQITVRINSPGGDVFDGLAIHNVLKSHKARIDVIIEGHAASIASVIAMSGDKVTMHGASMMMIHDAWAGVIGNSQDMMEMAGILDKIDGIIAGTYAARGKHSAKYYREAMDAETWYGAEEAVSAGLADAIHEPSSGNRSRSQGQRMSAELARRQRERRNRRAALDADSMRIAAMQRDALNRKENPTIQQQVADRVRALLRKVNTN